MDEYQLNASSLADKIGVQRSSLSHILSKRNKPSLDFILKIEKKFEKIDLNWLLFGKSSFEDIKENDQKNPNFTDLNSKTNHFDVKKTKIKEIIHLYEDGSFNVYFPKNKIE